MAKHQSWATEDFPKVAVADFLDDAFEIDWSNPKRLKWISNLIHDDVFERKDQLAFDERAQQVHNVATDEMVFCNKKAWLDSTSSWDRRQTRKKS